MPIRYLYGSAAADDELFATAFEDQYYMFGLSGDDRLASGEMNDRLYGGDGDDYIMDRAGRDLVDGGSGNDYFLIDDDFVPDEGMPRSPGADTVIGGSGFDVIAYRFSSSGVSVNLATGQGFGGFAEGDVISGVEAIEDSTYSDLLTGDARDNLFAVTLGDDTISGGEGTDTLIVHEAPATQPYNGWVFMIGANTPSNASRYNILAPVASENGSGIAFTSDGTAHMVEANGLHRLSGMEAFVGSAGNDAFFGDALANTFDGGALGYEFYDGGGGLDVVRYRAVSGAVIVDLATGKADGEAILDQFISIEGLVGSDYDDQFFGNAAANSLAGRDGNDVLEGRDGNDTLSGGEGIDVLIGGGGNDTMEGGAGAGDVIDGEQGVDAAVYYSSDAAIKLSLLTGVALGGHAAGDYLVNVENVVGSMYDDEIVGSNAINVLTGHIGRDVIFGCDGDDTLIGGLGIDLEGLIDLNENCGCLATEEDKAIKVPDGATDHDFLSGDVGNDKIFGQDGNDLLVGGVGNDNLIGGLGTDILLGDAGNDLLEGGVSFDVLIGGDGIDTGVYSNSSSGVTVNLSAQWENGGGEASADLLDLIRSFSGPLGPKNAWENALSIGFIALLDAAMKEAGIPGFPDVFVGVENLTGSAYADRLTGDEGVNSLMGAAGNDALSGLDGNDMLFGGSGRDTLNGGAGFDTATFEDKTVTVRIQLASGAGTALVGEAAEDNLAGIEALIGGSAADSLSGDANANRLSGGNGGDVLFGSDGNDTLEGGSGDDAIWGGGGVDQLSGGLDADWFLWSSASHTGLAVGSRDIIADFQTGVDRINLLAIDANTTLAGRQNFDFLGTAVHTGDGGTLRYTHSGGNTVIWGDRDADGAGDFAIQLTGVINLTAADFII